MAEILLSLTIIGLVAAITLPSLTGNINERVWNTQRKALHSRLSQALSLMPALNGYGQVVEANESTSAIDTAAETFVTAGLSKVLKINNICDSEHLSDCGIPSIFTNIAGSQKISFPSDFYQFNGTFESASFQYGGSNSVLSFPDLKAAAFETANGESLAVYYNPFCVVNSPAPLLGFIHNHMCANFVYDLNGTKGPNTVGKDMGFITALYSIDPIVLAPMPYAKDAMPSGGGIGGNAICKSFNENSRIPSIEELESMFFNEKFIGMLNTSGAHYNYYNSGTLSSSDFPERNDCWFWYINFLNGARDARGYGHSIRCIKTRE